MNKKNFKNEIIRINQIDKLSDSLFGHLAPDEIDSLGIEFEETTTRMLQVVVIKTKYVMAMDLFEDLEFKPLFFSDEILPLLRNGDVFLGTIGLRNLSWHLLYMSTLYS